MPDILIECERVARKDHTCDYCGKPIHKGEKYNYAKLKYDDLYDWKCHIECHYISGQLWNYIDPDEGMTEEDFREGCHEFCDAFICPSCEHYIDDECNEDNEYCLDEIYKHLLTHDFKRVKDDNGWVYTFKCFPKQ